MAASAAQISGFVESLQEPRTPYISPARFSKALGVKVSNLALLTGVHRNTLRNPGSERLQERMRQMIKVISAATEVTGDLQKAIFWFRNEPIGDYGHKTAAELVAEGYAEAVLAYLRDLESGGRRLKRVDLRPDQIFHRYLTPKWAFTPTSGAGAAMQGGRFNRPGVEALYLARSAHTALEEYRQGASIAPPATLAAYHVNVGDVVDFSGGYDPAEWPAEWREWNCAWKHIARIDRRTPPSWVLADAVIAAGAPGILFPSTRHTGGINLVLYPANLSGTDAVHVHDPAGALPKDQASWP